jgi:hypothetical protein
LILSAHVLFWICALYNLIESVIPFLKTIGKSSQ